jgi:hypothetical protein
MHSLDIVKIAKRYWIALPMLAFAIVESFQGRNDWDIFLSASRSLFAGEDVYAITFFDGYHYYYSLFFATLLYPFALLPAVLSKFLWLCINLLLVVYVFKRVMSYAASEVLTARAKQWLLLLLVICMLRFVKSNLHLGQTTILLLALSLEALHQESKGRSWLAGTWLALAITIKLLPAVFIPYWLYRFRLKAAFVAVLVCLGLWFLPSLWLGQARNELLMSSYLELIDPRQTKHVLDVEETSFHGLSTLLSTLLSAEAREHNGLDYRRHIADVSMEKLSLAITLVRLFFVLLTLWFLRTLPFKAAPGPYHQFREISYLFLIIPLIAPHQQHYAFLFALPAFACVLSSLLHSRYSYAHWRWIVLALVAVCFNTALWLGAFNAIYNHYKLVTYGALLLAVLLARVDLGHMENKKVGTGPTFQN